MGRKRSDGPPKKPFTEAVLADDEEVADDHDEEVAVNFNPSNAAMLRNLAAFSYLFERNAMSSYRTLEIS